MSELINAPHDDVCFRRQLLVTVSSVVLVASVCGIHGANAEDADRPTMWIELGADLDRVDGGQKAFAPAFVANNPGSTAFDPVSPAEAQKPPAFSFGGEGKLLFQPEGSDWVFSASVRYGRANSNRFTHQTAKNNSYYQHLVYRGRYGTFTNFPPGQVKPIVANFLHVSEKQSESHSVVDFQAGRDVGLGLFGREGTSVLNAGVRFAQFTSSTQSSIQARPDLAFVAVKLPTPDHPLLFGTIVERHYHQYVATAQSARSFHGVGRVWPGTLQLYSPEVWKTANCPSIGVPMPQFCSGGRKPRFSTTRLRNTLPPIILTKNIRPQAERATIIPR